MARRVKPLTSAQIESAKPKNKDFRLYDGHGLQLLVRKSGTKVWQYPYSLGNKTTIFTIGEYHKSKPGALGLKEARTKRHEVRALLDQGIDPNAQKKEDAQKAKGVYKTTFEALAREWHAKGVWAQNYAKGILSTLERDIFPQIGHLQIKNITRHDLIAAFDKIVARGVNETARRACKHCETIFDYAVIKGVCDDNPALGCSKYIRCPKPQPRPHLREEDLPEFLLKLEKYHGRNYVTIAMQLLVITFLRPGELRHLRWSDINFDRSLLTIPAERMKMGKAHTIPLSKQALLLLDELKPYTGNNDLLFPSIKNGNGPISDVTLTKVLRILGYTKHSDKHVVPHGFRHTASTILNEHGFNPDWIERQLAHVARNKIRGIYNHAEYLDDRRVMMQWYADHLDGISRS